jgi:hypothetical protein
MAGPTLPVRPLPRVLGPRHAGSSVSVIQIRVSDPAVLPDLVEFLGRASCVAAHRRGRTLDVELPHATSPEQARRELQLYLAAWRGLHPGVVAELVDAPAPAGAVAERPL